MNTVNYVQCRDWIEVVETMLICRRDGYKFSVDQQTFLVSYW